MAFGPLSARSFNVGRDQTFTLTINGQTFSTIGLITQVDRRSLSQMHEVVPMNNDGVAVRRTTYSGYEYDFHLTRQDGTFDLIVDSLQSNYYGGSAPPTITGFEVVRNPNSAASVDQFSLSGGTIVPESLGAFKGADPVNDINFKVVFSLRQPVGGSASPTSNLIPTSSQ